MLSKLTHGPLKIGNPALLEYPSANRRQHGPYNRRKNPRKGFFDEPCDEGVHVWEVWCATGIDSRPGQPKTGESDVVPSGVTGHG